MGKAILVPIETPAGKLENCLKTKETTPLEPALVEFKFYAPDIGLVRSGVLKLAEVIEAD